MKKILFLFLAIIFLAVGCSQKTSNDVKDDSSKPTKATVTKNDLLPETATENKLNLQGQGLEKIPDYVFSQTNLEELDVSGNKLTGAIQAEIGNLKDLKVLNLSNNQMTGVPAEIGHLPNLEYLDLSNNKLTGLPLELGNLHSLLFIDISGNDYSEQDVEEIFKRLPPGIRYKK